jgi:hypothetical protein
MPLLVMAINAPLPVITCKAAVGDTFRTDVSIHTKGRSSVSLSGVVGRATASCKGSVVADEVAMRDPQAPNFWKVS